MVNKLKKSAIKNLEIDEFTQDLVDQVISGTSKRDSEKVDQQKQEEINSEIIVCEEKGQDVPKTEIKDF